MFLLSPWRTMNRIARVVASALLRPAARHEAPKPQDLLVGPSAMGLPAAGRAHARDERSDRMDIIALTAGRIETVNAIQVLFERPN